MNFQTPVDLTVNIALLIINTSYKIRWPLHTLCKYKYYIYRQTDRQTDRQFIQTYTYSTSSQHKLYNEICHVYLHICEIKNEQISVSLTVTIKRKISYTLIDSHAHTRARTHTRPHARTRTHTRSRTQTHAYTIHAHIHIHSKHEMYWIHVSGYIK